MAKKHKSIFALGIANQGRILHWLNGSVAQVPL